MKFVLINCKFTHAAGRNICDEVPVASERSNVSAARRCSSHGYRHVDGNWILVAAVVSAAGNRILHRWVRQEFSDAFFYLSTSVC